jgi:hypothetical protein
MAWIAAFQPRRSSPWGAPGGLKCDGEKKRRKNMVIDMPVGHWRKILEDS